VAQAKALPKAVFINRGGSPLRQTNPPRHHRLDRLL
jgi:hypothetical protein